MNLPKQYYLAKKKKCTDGVISIVAMITSSFFLQDFSFFKFKYDKSLIKQGDLIGMYYIFINRKKFSRLNYLNKNIYPDIDKKFMLVKSINWQLCNIMTKTEKFNLDKNFTSNIKKILLCFLKSCFLNLALFISNGKYNICLSKKKIMAYIHPFYHSF